MSKQSKQKTVGQAFNDYNHYLAQFQQINQSRVPALSNYITKNLSLTVHQILKSGSYDRKVRVPYDSDLDVVILLNRSKPAGGASKFFNNIWSKIYQTNRNASKGYRAFKFQYNGVSVDFVPAWGNNGPVWNIANDRYNIWEQTNPAKNKQELTKVNNSNKYKVIPMIRFFKVWNYNEKCRFQSFHLEVIIMEIFKNNSKFKTFKWAELTKNIANKLPSYLNKSLKEPAGVGPNLQVRPSDHLCLKKRIDKLINNCNRAINLEESSGDQKAIGQWKKIFDKNFG